MNNRFKSQLDKDLYNLKRRENYKKDPEKHRLRSKIYKQSHKDEVAVYMKSYRKINRLTIRKKKCIYEKLRIQRDPLYKITLAIRSSICQSFLRKGKRKSTKTESILCCSFLEFRQYIENQFEPWMTWDNYGLYDGKPNKGWDLDHIIPLVSASCEAEVIKLNHYSNFQPLCSYVNRDVKKHNYE